MYGKTSICKQIQHIKRYLKKWHVFYLFIYLLLLGRRQLPMRPGGNQHPKEITHTHKIYSKQLDRQ